MRIFPASVRFLSLFTLLLSIFLTDSEYSIFAADAPVTALEFSSDHKFLFAAQDHLISIYNYPKLELARTFQVRFSKIHDIKVTPDQKNLAIAGGNPGESGEVCIYDLNAHKIIFTQICHKDSTMCINWLNDSRRYLTGSLTGKIALSQLHQGDSIREFHGHSKGVIAAVFLEYDQSLVTASLDQSLRVWDVQTGEIVRTLNNHTAAINDMELSPHHDALPVVVSVANDRAVRFWQPTIGRMIRFVKLESIPLTVEWHPHLPIVIVTTSSGRLFVIDYQTAAVLAEVPTQQPWMHALAISPDGEHAIIQNELGLQKINLRLSRK